MNSGPRSSRGDLSSRKRQPGLPESGNRGSFQTAAGMCRKPVARSMRTIQTSLRDAKRQATAANLGNSPDIISQIKLGLNPFSEILKHSRRPMVILGAEQLNRKDGPHILAETQSLCKTIENQVKIAKDWKVMNILHTNASQVAALDLGYKATLEELQNSEPRMLFLLGADESSIKKENFGKSFIVYIGSHGDHGASIADVVLPGAAYTEKCGTYVNMEGRAQQTNAAITPPGMARPDWKIVRALSEMQNNLI
ncbi:hypothetical protein TSAR_007926 [Trichomalopsis sarcophagae]|uniref:Molybdopterin oxidoreductase domain-containing protein n=1 Tax=Trichomalopsis sarcophagae TaxID=543379 RepID=A0A232FAP7_9HYME|nr:hypothetical protein TSAR_007926 [Trichomalopsis sarcophagae]